MSNKMKFEYLECLMTPVGRPGKNFWNIYLCIGHSDRGADTALGDAELRHPIDLVQRTIASSGEEEYRHYQWTTAS